MLTCPFCKFENADLSRSCDQCGQPFQRWRIIDLPEPASPALSVSDLNDSLYLDADHRYQLLGQLSAPARSFTVIDCQPQAGSPLQDLQLAWLDDPTLDPASHPLGATIPAAAYPYLALQADYFPAVPELHHAWRTPQRTLLLIEDRTRWLPFTAGWAAIADPLQQIQWLFETTLLWQALAPWQRQATLLDPQHITLNENNLLCLTQIDQAATPAPLPLHALGQLWQQLLTATPTHLPPSVQALVTALAAGNISTVGQLQDTLAEAAQCYQEPVTEAESPLAGHQADNGQADSYPASYRPASDDEFPAASLPLPSPFAEDPDVLSETADSDLDAAFDTQEIIADDEGNGGIEAPTMVLPMKLAHLDDAGQSHVGQQRRHNEDWFYTHTQTQKVGGPQGAVLRSKGTYILCDGMGGHAAGEVASQLAVRTLRDYLAQHWSDRLPNQDTLADAVFAANQAIFDINQSNATSGVGRMGTTLVMVLLHNLDVAVVHVGDSRLYGYSKRLGLRQLTLDHEVGQREINRGVEPALAYARPDAYQLTQALGPRGKEDLLPSVAYHDITEDTLLILCSDGLSDNDLLERHVDTHIAPLLSAKASLDNGVAQLIDLANEKNGHDNITAILVRIKLQPDLASMAG